MEVLLYAEGLDKSAHSALIMVPQLTINPFFLPCRSGGGIASVMNSGPIDAAAAPKERSEVCLMSLACEILNVCRAHYHAGRLSGR